MENAVTTSERLTQKQEKFCLEYVASGGNATAAARRAGYADDGSSMIRVTAHENLTNPNILTRIQKVRDECGIKNEVTLEWALAVLTDTVRRCMQEEPVYVNGIPSGEYRFNAHGVIKSIALITKIMGWKDQSLKEEAKPVYASEAEEKEEIEKHLLRLEHEALSRYIEDQLGEDRFRFSTEEINAIVDNMIKTKNEVVRKIEEEIIRQAILGKNKME